MDEFKEAPFYLDDEDLRWVEATLSRMSLDDKIGQIFCLVSYRSDAEWLTYVAKTLKIGGIMCRPGPLEDVVSTVSLLQEASDIPMLVAANLEMGGDGVCLAGTHFGSPMAVAATGDVGLAYRLGVTCGREASALGVNWAFAPVVDIDLNFRNPITNTRTFGSDPRTVAAMAAAFVQGLQAHGVAATIKHFPGDGVDERDQHLVTTVNSLECEEWDRTFGEVYRACIDAGALAVMAGHIALPAYSRKLNPGIKDQDILPASLAYEITTILLKEQLGFKGLVVSDSTTMGGMSIAMERPKAVPRLIAAGCDVFLFTRNLDEDLKFMREGVRAGVVSETRLDEAVRKVLSLKAALRLHKKKADGTLIPNIVKAREILGCREHQEWARECAERSITLVKAEAGVLPLSPEKTKRVLLFGLEKDGNTLGGGPAAERVTGKVKRLLEREGFSVEVFVPTDGLEGNMPSYEEIVSKYDLMIYVANLGPKSNQTTVRIEWAPPMGSDLPIYIHSVPTIFISLENPYHLLDVPRVRTYINTYNCSDVVLEALVAKLMGRSPFVGVSPVDPFCGKWDTRL